MFKPNHTVLVVLFKSDKLEQIFNGEVSISQLNGIVFMEWFITLD